MLCIIMVRIVLLLLSASMTFMPVDSSNSCAVWRRNLTVYNKDQFSVSPFYQGRNCKSCYKLNPQFNGICQGIYRSTCAAIHNVLSYLYVKVSAWYILFISAETKGDFSFSNTAGQHLYWHGIHNEELHQGGWYCLQWKRLWWEFEDLQRQ